MKPFLKFGLLVGVVGFFVIIPVAVVLGICGPGVTLVAGAIAGFLTAYGGRAATSREGAQSGAIAGAISGGVMLLGQLLGGMLIVAFAHVTQTPPVLGTVPSLSAPLSELIPYYSGGLVGGLCFGWVGVLLGALAGGLAGAFGARPGSRSASTAGSVGPGATPPA